MFGTVFLRKVPLRAYPEPISAVQMAQMKDIAIKMIPTITKIPKNHSEDGKWERKSRSMNLLWNVFFSRTVINYAKSCKALLKYMM